MPLIRFTTLIHAPIERCFDLARSIDFHVHSLSSSGEKAIGGVQSGLIGFDEEVTWCARHFGVRQTLTSRITAYDRPNHFRDSMIKGAFKSFDHDHFFTRKGESTNMEDVFDFEAPMGLLGRIADVLFLKRYLQDLLLNRARQIKTAAESDAWRTYLNDSSNGCDPT